MKFSNVAGVPADWTLGFDQEGREMLIVAIKATYRLPLHGEAAERADEQVPLVEADRFTGEPGLSAPRYETDYAHRKPACDVLLLGQAHAPDGRPVTRLGVGLKVGGLAKQFAVVGNRFWYKGLAGVSASEPQPFTTLPLSYDTAFGGTDRTREADGKIDTFLANPVGRGYWRYDDLIEGQPLPSTEAIDQPIEHPTGSYRPMAFSPIGRNWAPRLSYAGTYDDAWAENTAPLWPEDFDWRYFQAAPPDQIIPYPEGGETVILSHLTADGRRGFTLPACKMPVTFIPHKGRDVTREARVDTLVIEPELERFTLTWRANLPLGKSVFDVKETIVGEMSAAWHRTRRFPGKTYYRSLDELVRARRGGGRS